ncbi:MAG: 4-hydroxy-tetrahydrodipicolinate synthase [Oscillospiraceae bacterium]|nr:4-hydroxy-tetrahydrodipicolinate synthase [Oscillospiraceae bacterium]
MVFKGAATALITPFHKDGTVDFEALDNIIELQISAGINGLVICGTTGEKATLNDEEHVQVLRHAVTVAKGRTPIIAGTGSNDTAHAVWMTKEACDVGCDAVLVCTPYYNKTTQNGLIEMFTVIADASDKPVILYNVPSRTGVAIEPETYIPLADHPMIAGIKEANGDIAKISKTMAYVGDKIAVYSGNDDHVIPIMSLGGQGVVSVLSNIMPAETVEMCERWFKGDTAGAAKMQLNFVPLVNALFSEVNPIPVKAAMAALGLCENKVRLPLVPMEKAHEEILLARMREQGLKV